MALPANRISFAEYSVRFGHETGWEFQAGQAVRKPMPTFLHGLLAILLGDLLRLAGYYSSVEVDVRLTPDWSPRPDACGILRSPVNLKYPTTVDIICEIQSEDEDIVAKCLDYAASGAVTQIYVFNAEEKTICQWNGGVLHLVEDMLLPNGVTIPGRTLWRELDKREKQQPLPPASMVVELPE